MLIKSLFYIKAILHGYPTIWCDNLCIMALSASLVCHARAKRVELDIHFVRDWILAFMLLVLHIPSHE